MNIEFHPFHVNYYLMSAIKNHNYQPPFFLSGVLENIY